MHNSEEIWPIDTSTESDTSEWSFLKAVWTKVGRSKPLLDHQICSKTGGQTHVKMFALRWTEGELFVIERYRMPPSWTIPSKGVTSKPASTASARVTVKRAEGSKFIFRSRVGDCVVDLGADTKSVVVSMVPNGIPNVLTVDEILVIWSGALNGFTRETVTWLMLFARPVVGNTGNSATVSDMGNDSEGLYMPFRAAVSRRFVDKPGNVTLISSVLKASTSDAISVLPSKPAIVSCTSVETHKHSI